MEDATTAWGAADEDWDDLGLGNFDAAGVAALAAAAVARRLNYTEQGKSVFDLITDSSAVAEAKLIKKYKGLRFVDEDDEGGYFRIRSERFSCLAMLKSKPRVTSLNTSSTQNYTK